MFDQWQYWKIFALVFGVIFLLDHLYFVWLPQRAIKKYQDADPERLRRYLERVVATPTPFPASKLVARSMLITIHINKGEHAKAAACCQVNLAVLTQAKPRRLFHLAEADTRRRFADCLEALGRPDEADSERREAEACVARAPRNPVQWLLRGKTLERENRYDEATREFEQALKMTPESDRQGRIQCLVHLVLSCHNAGRPADSLDWAEQTIALGATGMFLRTAHRMASIALGNLGRLDEAEEHCQKAHDLAMADGNVGARAEILGSLADIQRKRGRLAEAYQSAEEAAKVDPQATRIAYAVQLSVLREWGRFDEALLMMERHDSSKKVVIPALERRLMAASNLDRSRIEAESGKADDAWIHIQEAVAVLGNDPKLGLKCDGAAAWIFAARGLAEDSRRVADQVKERLADFEQDPSTQRGALYDLGMAACVRGDHDEGIDCWTRYLGLKPDPVHRPTAFYFRGECRRQLGDRTGAKADYDAAIGLEIDSHYARLARSRRGEMSLL